MVSFKVSDKNAEAVPGSGSESRYGRYDHFIEKLDEYEKEGCIKVLQGTHWSKEGFRQSKNGFVRGVIAAYNGHHNLVIRPDDVWLAITIQFGLFVNANAEALRSVFVDHEGKKELVVSAVGTLTTVDYGPLAAQMSVLLKQNVKDEQVCDWVLPNFSTTTKNDVVVGSVVLMATMKNYFDYTFQLKCGIPYVTLEGTTEDWEEVHRRVDQLSKYGGECVVWSEMLKEVTGQFVRSSKGDVDLGFWSKVCHHIGWGSGPRYISGWISVFCVFDKHGKWQGVVGESEEYPKINMKNIPNGYLTVDVKVVDNESEYQTLMFAGHMGYDAVDEKTIAPKIAWAIALKEAADKTSKN